MTTDLHLFDESFIANVLSDLKDKEYLRISDLQRNYSLGFPKASKLLNLLMELGVLAKEETGSKGHRVLQENIDKPERCSLCGNELALADKLEGFRIHHHFGGGSKHKGKELDVALCRDCMDKSVELLVPFLKESPWKD